DQTGTIIMSNPAGREIWTGARYVGLDEYGEYKGWWADTGKPIASDEWPLARAISRGETSINDIIEIECFDSTRKIILNSAVPIRDSNGTITAAIIVNQDITQLKRAEEDRKKLSSVVEQSLDDILIINREGIIEYANPAFENHTGYSREEALGKNPHLLKPGRSDERRWKGLWQSILSGTPFRDVVTNRKRSGEPYHEELTITPIKDHMGAITHVVAIGKDITERVRIEKALRDSEARLANAQRIARLGNWEWDIEKDELTWSEEIHNIFGIPPVVIGVTFEAFLEAVHPDDREFVRKTLELVLASGGTCGIDHRIGRRDGSERIVHEQAEVTFDHAGRPVRMTGTIQDITERKHAEELLRRSEERYRRLIETASDIIFSVSDEGLVTSLNPAFVRMTGWSCEEWIGKPFEAIIHHEDREATLGRLRRSARGESVPPSEFRLLTRDGGSIVVETISAPQIEDGRIVGQFGIARDVTDRKQTAEKQKRLETQLRQSQKMEAIGTLSGGIAHDFNNILGVMIGFTQLAGLAVPQGNKAQEHLQDVLKAGRRAKDLVTQILSFSRQREQEYRPVAIDLVVREALKMLRSSLPSTIEIQANVASTSMVLADATQIHQLLMNLCTNASHAMREHGGMLEVSLMDIFIDDPFVDRNPEFKVGPHVRLSVCDTGYGMSREVMERIFDPYFTTKAPGEGTGLGLAIVHGIVKNHGGGITVYSEVGRGTTITVYLPRLGEEDRSFAGIDGESMKNLPTGSESILFVDDEEGLCASGLQILTMLGYSVYAETSSVNALEVFRARPDDFDLVVTDLTMPKMTGIDLATELHRIRPDLPIILCTGFSQTITSEKASTLGICEIVLKPVVLQEMAETIRRVLDAKPI
ncbi:MAG: PAS domain S-box protein, partial [Acidobacteriota bacterium]